MDTPIIDPITPSNEAIDPLIFPEAEDFRVIGLRPMEFRPAVIRRAMSRSAMPLATLHLNHPDRVVERKLSQVVTTGYRLLDPRRREDSIQRMMLGRIHPQLADEAVRIAQSKGNHLAAIDSADGVDEESYHGAGLIRIQDYDHQKRRIAGNYFVDDSTSKWSNSLRSQDLLVERPMKRMIRTTRRWVARRYVATGTAVGFLLVAWGTWRLASDRDPVIVADSSAAIAPAAMPAVEIRPLPVTRPIVAEVVGEEKVDPSPIGPMKIGPSTIAAGHEPSALAAGLVESANGNSMPEASANGSLNQAVSSAQSETPAPSPPLSPEPVVDAPFVDAMVAAEADEGQDLLPSTTVAQAVDPATTDTAIEAIIPPVAKLPVPIDAELSESKASWGQAVAKIASNDLHGKREASVRFADDAADPSVDTADRPLDVWIGLIGAAGFAVAAEDYAASDRLLQRLMDTFETDLPALAKTVSVQLESQRLSDSESASVHVWLETWFGRSMVAGILEDADYFIARMTENEKNRDEKMISERTKQLRDSLVTAKRLAETALKLDADSQAEISPSDHFAAGRYWALVRRDWVKALPHLSAASDARLANLAATELLTGASPSPTDLMALADGYLSMAGKLDGWLGESYVLHADEILHREAQASSNAKSLELARLQTKLHTEHEAVFAQASRLVTAKLDTKVPAAESEAIVKNENGMLGRVSNGGVDVGVLLRYEPGARLTKKAFEQIAGELKTDLSLTSIDLVGVMKLERPTAVSIHSNKIQGDSLQVVSIDGQELEVISDESTEGDKTVYRADLAPGNWMVRWSVSSGSDDLVLRVMDALSGSPVALQTPPPGMEKHPSLLPTRLRVTVASGQ